MRSVPFHDILSSRLILNTIYNIKYTNRLTFKSLHISIVSHGGFSYLCNTRIDFSRIQKSKVKRGNKSCSNTLNPISLAISINQQALHIMHDYIP